MSGLAADLADLIDSRDKPAEGAPGGHKKNYTEALSHDISRVLAESLRTLGLTDVRVGTVLGEAAVVMSGIAQRRLPTDAPELYEAIGILLFDPGDPHSLDLAPDGVPEALHAASYPRRLVHAFNRRNPFY